MASANLDLVRSIFAAMERGDFVTSVEWADPEVEWVIADGPEPSSLKGVTAYLEWWRDFLIALGGVSHQGGRVPGARRRPGSGAPALRRWARQDERPGTRGARRGRSRDLAHPGRQGDARGDLLQRERAVADLGLAPEAPSAGSAAPGN